MHSFASTKKKSKKLQGLYVQSIRCLSIVWNKRESLWTDTKKMLTKEAIFTELACVRTGFIFYRERHFGFRLLYLWGLIKSIESIDRSRYLFFCLFDRVWAKDHTWYDGKERLSKRGQKYRRGKKYTRGYFARLDIFLRLKFLLFLQLKSNMDRI